MGSVYAALSNGRHRGELIEGGVGGDNTAEQQQKRKSKWTASYSDLTIAQLEAEQVARTFQTQCRASKRE